ncbi:MAG: hypothetical protein H6R13_1386 [Proteobacteria bacterium]|nr:hypothetical protein [Pseudomonadota bacterium]
MVMDTGTDMTKNKPNRLANLQLLAGTCLCAYSIAALSQQAITGSAISSNPSTTVTPSPQNLDTDKPEIEPKRAFTIIPRVKLTETWSDNVDIGRTQNNKQSGLITELAPGIHVDARTARLRAYFDYALIGQYYTQPSGYSRTQNALNTFGTLEAVTNWLFLDFSGVIAQQAISAFGTQTPNSSYQNNNSTETATYRLSPYIRGQLPIGVNYNLRYNRSTTQASAASVSDIDLSEWSGQLSGSTAFQSLKWAIDGSQQNADYSLGRKTDAQRINATATYTIVPQFRISASGGQESNNYASADQLTHNTYGAGFDWTPTERTQFSVFKDRRFFGDGHRINISHRFPLSSISYSDTRDVSVLPNQFTSVGLGTFFDLFKQLCTQIPDSPYPDPDTCAIQELAKLGYAPNTQFVSSFLNSRATVQRRQQLALAMQGARNTLTLMLTRNDSETIMASQAVNDDFALNNVTSIKQRGLSANLSHKLSAVSSLNFLVSRQESTGTGVSVLKTTSTLYQLNLISKLSAKTTGTVGARRTEFDSTSNPYTENALIGSISVIF